MCIRDSKARIKVNAANKQVIYNVSKLKDENVHIKYNLGLQNRFAELSQLTDVEDEWENFRETINETAEMVLGRRRGTKKERWISECTWKSIDERRVIKAQKEQTAITGGDVASVREKYKQKDKEVKKNCKKDKQQWINDRANEAEAAAKLGNTKVLYQIVKELPKSNTNQPPIKNKDGKYATTCDQQMWRWKEHFSSVLNCSEPEAPHDFEGDSADIPALDVS